MIRSGKVDRTDHFIYLKVVISADVLVSDETSARIQEIRLKYANLNHSWFEWDVSLPTKSVCTAKKSGLPCGCGTFYEIRRPT